MARIEIHLFGNLEVTLDGKALNTFESVKVRALLAYLAAESIESHPREKLAGLLWADWPQKSAMSNLRYALADLRKNICDQEANPSVLLVSRESLQFNPLGQVKVDTHEFTQGVRRYFDCLPGNKLELVNSLKFYRADFLSSFYLPDSPEFEHWVLAKREFFRESAHKACTELIERLIELGEYDQAFEYARLGIALEPWAEEGHRQAMRILGLQGKRNEALVQFEVFKRDLQKELGIQPSQETIALYDQIRGERLVYPKELPVFLQSLDAGEVQEFPIVARQPEIEKLNRLLDLALSGKGGVAFITGEPGRGKTTLIKEFVRKAIERYPSLLVAQGNCQAYFGKGDTYLPFREILAVLTGDVEQRWKAGSIRREYALRLWAKIPLTAQAIVEKGPALIETLLPGQSLLERVRLTVEGEPGWVKRLGEIVEVRQKAAGGIHTTQEDLFTQYKNVLFHIATKAPVLLIVDDLQWVDDGSSGLFFSLGRSLAGSQLFILGSYRENETGESLNQVLRELRLVYGDIEIGLETKENDQFVEAYLKTQPNLLSARFKQKLCELTSGHPLYTVELLKGMVERGEIVKNERGEWEETGTINWEKLPVKIEAAIGERVNRLPAEVRELLKVASVQGEEFSVEVLAGVMGESIPKLFNQLGLEAERKYQMVNADRVERVNGKRLSRYRFRHILIQRCLYQELDDVLCSYLHEQVANTLESFYGEEVKGIATLLSHHFEQADLFDKAIQYLYISAETASGLYSHQDVSFLINHAISLLDPDELQWHYKLLLLLEKDRLQAGELDVEGELFRKLEKIASKLGIRQQAEVEILKANGKVFSWDFKTGAEISSLAVKHAQEAGDIHLEAEASLILAIHAESIPTWERSLLLAQQSGDKNLEAVILREYGVFDVHDPVKSLEYCHSSLLICRKTGDRYTEGRVLNIIGFEYTHLSEPDRAIPYHEESLIICREVGNRWDEYFALSSLIETHIFLGHCLEKIPGMINKAIELSNRLGYQNLQPRIYFWSGCYFLSIAEYEKAYQNLHKAIELFESTEQFHLFQLRTLGDVCLELNRVEEAEKSYSTSLEGFLQKGMEEYAYWVKIAQTKKSLTTGEIQNALEELEKLLPLPQKYVGWVKNNFFLLQDYLAGYRVFKANRDSRAVDTLRMAYQILTTRAERIEDEEIRKSYLENIPWNREIIRLWRENE